MAIRLHIASDLHLEFLQKKFPAATRVQRLGPDQADCLILAGDIHQAEGALRSFADWPIPVFYVLGNHEFYSDAIEPVVEKIRRLSQGTSLRVLYRETAVVGRTRILGATLWTDYEAYGAGEAQRKAMRSCASHLADHRLIVGVSRRGDEFSPAKAYALHQEDRRWLEEELAKDWEGQTVVVSHHAPCEGSCHPRFWGDPCSPGFYSKLPELLAHADLWVHGHVHDSFDYRRGRCRVVCNPSGYPSRLGWLSRLEDLRFENPRFDPGRVVSL